MSIIDCGNRVALTDKLQLHDNNLVTKKEEWVNKLMDSVSDNTQHTGLLDNTELPIASLRPAFQNAFATQPLIITAPTGSGKSTMVPLWCTELSDRPTLVLEPRRVACRSLARWLSKLRGEPLGTSVGYTVRFEDVGSETTQIRFVTPGLPCAMRRMENLIDMGQSYSTSSMSVAWNRISF